MHKGHLHYRTILVPYITDINAKPKLDSRSLDSGKDLSLPALSVLLCFCAGLDYLGYAIAEHRGYALLLFFFLIFQSMILLIGLIGVFGDAFVSEASSASNQKDVQRAAEGAKKVKPGHPVKQEVPNFVLYHARAKMKEANGAAYWSVVVLTTFLALAEPFIICLRERLTHGLWVSLQLAVLIASTAIYAGLMFSTYHFIDKEKAGPGVWQRVMCLFDLQVKFDTACLAMGCSFLIRSPGIACLRCLRVFRVLWFFEVVSLEKLENPGEHALDLTRCFHLCVQVPTYSLHYLSKALINLSSLSHNFLLYVSARLESSDASLVRLKIIK